MEYKFLNSAIDLENINLPQSNKINPFVLKSCYTDAIKALEFLNSDGSFLYVHGFLGTGKRQFINYITDFIDKDVIKLEYYCKESTVCDDILLSFISEIEKSTMAKAVTINSKIMALSVKFSSYLSSIKKPFLIVLHSFDDVSTENRQLIVSSLQNVIKNQNVKIVLSMKALEQDVLGDVKFDRKIFLKAFSKELFQEFLTYNHVTAADATFEDFYNYTRGYYYYTALVINIVKAMNISLNEFLEKFAMSGMSFDSYIGFVYVNLIPKAIRNFFWFLRTLRHGISINALAAFELYDEFSLEYLKSNLMVFQVDETVYVQDYFLQEIDVSIPTKVEIKLHKYIINIYEQQLKEPVATRVLTISRQAMRAEIDYHTKCIDALEHGGKRLVQEVKEKKTENPQKEEPKNVIPNDIDSKIQDAKKFEKENKNTDAIEIYNDILNTENINSATLIEVRLFLARIYKKIGEFSKSEHYYELIETYYMKHNEVINLNYLYFELADLYYLSYKQERAVETIKKVVYSTDTPQSLMVSACIILGNIYSEMKKSQDALSYYKKALDSLDENVNEQTMAELYFKYALVCDDLEDSKSAFEYYNKCTFVNNSPYKASAYSNMAALYYESGNDSDAKDCFEHAYDIEKSNNNFEGIYYNAVYLAKLYSDEDKNKSMEFLIEAKQCAEFLNEENYILEASIALGDFYYNNPNYMKQALSEYYNAKKVAQNMETETDISKIDQRIEDMRLRMNPEDFEKITRKYE